MRLIAAFFGSSRARWRALFRKTVQSASSGAHSIEPADDASALFAQARAMHQKMQLDEAETIYKSLLIKYPEDFDLLHMLGVVQGQRGEFAAAATYLKRALSIDPVNALALCAYGNVLKGQGEGEMALACFDRALAQRPNDADIWSNRGATLTDLCRYQEALASYERALSSNGRHVQALDNRGTVLRNLRRFEEALVSHDDALALHPGYGAALYHRGLVLIDLGRLDEARESLEQALTISPDDTDVLVSLAYVLYSFKCFDGALVLFDRALSLRPGQAEVHLNRGATLKAIGRHTEALDALDQVLALDPEHTEAHFSRGMVLTDLKRFDEALLCYEKVLATKPDYVEAHNNRGSVLNELHRESEALASFSAALAIKPDHDSALINRGNLFLKLKRFDDAEADLEKLLALGSEDADVHNSLSTAYWSLGRFADAERHLLRAIQIKPGVANVYYNLATLLMQQGRLGEAIGQLESSLEHNSAHHAARSVMLHLKQKTCRWNDLYAHTEVLRQSLWAAEVTAESMISPFLFMAFPGTTPAEQKRCAERWARHEYESLAELGKKLAFVHERNVGKKLNIGYLSADFRNHPVARLMVRVFELHDRDQCHVTAYSYGPDDGSEIRGRVQRAVDRFIDIREMADVDVARRIHDECIHILVDLTGYTDLTRSGILALRPAPLQMSYLGYVGTMGANFVDYLITDRLIIPEDQQAHYSENPLYLPNCFQASDNARSRPPSPSRTQCGLPENAFIFCSFNHTYKITPEMFGMWCRLLTAVPGSVLWLVNSTAEAEANLKREAEARGVDPSRLIMAPLVSIEAYLARMQCADLYLDTSPYGAGTTANDALWMGVPLVTCMGETFSSRMAGSLLTALGVPELIGYSFDDYYRIALDLATDSNKLRRVREKMEDNSANASLFDIAKFTRDLEVCFRDAMNKWMAQPLKN